MWTVIIFIKDNTIEVVPIKWLIGEKEELCYWPPKGNIKSLIINSAQPSDSWEVYGVRFPNNRKKTFDNFLKARSACNALAEDSEIVSDEETEKRKRKKKNFSSSEEEEEDNTKSSLPPPPPLPNNSMDPMTAINVKSFKARVETPKPMAGILCNNTPTSTFPSLGNSQNSCSVATPTTFHNDSRVLRQLVLINNKLDNLAKDICCIIEKQDRASIPVEDDEEAIDHDFPLKTVDDIESFELFLQNKEYYSKFVHYISLLGGNGNWDAVKRAMERCFTDDIAQLYSWHGMRGKKTFGSLKFAKGVIEGIKKNSQLKNETDSNLEKSIKSWLRHAKERITKKK